MAFPHWNVSLVQAGIGVFMADSWLLAQRVAGEEHSVDNLNRMNKL